MPNKLFCIAFTVLISSLTQTVFGEGLTPQEIAFAQELLQPTHSKNPLTSVSSSKALQLLNNKKLVLSALNQNGLDVKYAHPDLRNDYDVMLRAVSRNGLALRFASDVLKDNYHIVQAAIKKEPAALQYASSNRRNDKKLALMAVQIRSKAYLPNGVLPFVSNRLKKDKEVILAAIKKDSDALKHAAPELQNDPYVVQAALRTHRGGMKYASKQLKSNKNFVLTEIYKRKSDCRNIFANADESLLADRDFILRVVKIKDCAEALNVHSLLVPRFKNDKEIAMIAVTQDGDNLKLFSPTIRNDKRIVRAAIKQQPYPIRHAGSQIKKDKEFAAVFSKVNHTDSPPPIPKDKLLLIKYLQKNPYSFSLVDLKFRKSKDVLLAIAKKRPEATIYLKATSLKKQDVIAAVKADGGALEYASNHFKKDKDVALAAVSKSGGAIRFVDKTLRNNRAIKLAAINTDSDGLRNILYDKKLTLDRDLVLTAMKASAYHFKELPKRFKKDKAIVLAAIRSKLGSISDNRNIDKDIIIDDEIINVFIDSSLHKGSVAVAFIQRYLSYLSKPIASKPRLLQILRKSGLALEYATPQLKKDRSVVQTALQQTGNAIAFADQSFKRDKYFVSTAIKKSASAYDYIDAQLKTDIDTALLATYKGNKNVLKTLYGLLDTATASVIIPSQKNSRYETQKVELQLDTLPPFYSKLDNTHFPPRFIVSADGSRLAGVLRLRPQAEGLIAIWNSKSGKLLHSSRVQKSMMGSHFSFTPDNKRFVSTGGGFIWNFAKYKKPIPCYLDTTIRDISNNAIMMHPNDWVEQVYNLDNCEPIAFATVMNIPTPVLGPKNKLLMISAKKLDKNHKDVILYRKKPEHREHSKNFRKEVDVWEIPLPKINLNHKDRLLIDHPKNQLLVLRFDSSNTLTISKWNYAKKRLIWKSRIKNIKPLVNPKLKDEYDYSELYKTQENFANNRLYLNDKNSIRTIDLKMGKVIKKVPEKVKVKVKEYGSNYIYATSFYKTLKRQLYSQGHELQTVEPSGAFSYHVYNHLVEPKHQNVQLIDVITDKEITLLKFKSRQ